MASVTVSGLAKAKSRLRKLSSNLNQIIPAIREDLHNTRIEIQSKAPVRTGYMRDHIVDREIPGGAEVHSQAPYSVFVELGTRFMAPRNFFRPSAYTSLDRLKKAIRRILRK